LMLRYVRVIRIWFYHIHRALLRERSRRGQDVFRGM